MKRIVALFMAGVLLLTSLEMPQGAAAPEPGAQQAGESVQAEIRTVIQEDAQLELGVGASGKELYIYHKETGKEYFTAAPEQEVEGTKGPVRMKLQSLVTGVFYDLELKKETDFYTSSGDVKVQTRELENGGVRMEFSLNNGLSFAVEAGVLDGMLKLRIPSDSLVETERFVFKQLQLAPNLLSAGAMQDGYLLIPDGCGALINFNNGKSGIYDEPVYGSNKAFVYEAYAVAKETVHLPVFGMERDGESVLAVISQGAAIARVRAATNGNETIRNRIYPTFLLREKDQQYITDDVSQTVIQEKLVLECDMEVTYLFGTDGGGYSEMARMFREYMTNTGVKAAEQNGSCVLLSIFGAVKEKQKLFGVPLYDKAQQITSCESVRDMIDQVSDQLSSVPVIRLAAWDKDTVLGYGVGSFSPVGGKKELTSLLSFCEENKMPVYLSEPFVKVQRSGKGIRLKKHAIRNLASELSVQYHYYRASNSANYNMPKNYLLDSSMVTGRAEKLLDSIDSYGFTGLAVEDLSCIGYANYRKGQESSKEMTAGNFSLALERMAEEYPLLLEGGYYYSLPYGTLVYNAPETGSGLDLADAEIPFYQMALSGIRAYAGTAVNQKENRRNALLKCLETGSLIQYEMAEETAALKGTALEDLYGAQWKLTAATIKAELAEFEPALQKVVGSPIIKHEILQQGVTCTIYENGWTVIVNHGTLPVDVNGQQVDGLDYVMERSEGA